LFEANRQHQVRAFCFLLLCLSLPLLASAAVPVLDHIYPCAVQAGTSNLIEVIGKFDPWPPQFWTDSEGIRFTAQTNTGKLQVIVDTDAPAGPHLVRAYNKRGTSEPRFFFITREPQIQEKEPNDHLLKAQMLSRLPAHINGRLDKLGDVDCYAFHLEKGQTLIASAEAYVLRSPMDAVLRLVNTNGTEVAFNHDDGKTLDPFLTWTADVSSTYVIQLFAFAHPAGSDIKFTGGNTCIYRLNLSKSPYLRYTRPLGLRRNASNSLQVFGWNLDAAEKRVFELQESDIPKPKAEKILSLPGLEGEVILPISDCPQTLEADFAPNTTHPVEIPLAITGCISRRGEVDRYSISAKKGDRLRIQVRAACFGFPLDAWVSVADAKGKELVRNDDANGGSDPSLDWTATNGNSFVISVGNVLHRGGPEFLYHLSIEPPTPDWKAVVPSSSFTVELGKTNEIKIAIKRFYGFSEKLKLDVRGLVEGVSFTAADVVEKTNEAVVKLYAPTNMTPASGPFQIIVKANAQEKPAWNDFAGTSVDNGVPTGFNKLRISGTDQLWLTVLPHEESEEKDKKAEKKK
jgi:hypothetical protein